MSHNWLGVAIQSAKIFLTTHDMLKYNVYNLYRGTVSQGCNYTVNYTETEALF